MCGLTGFWTKETMQNAKMNRIITLMSDSISHRGPDQGNIWTDCQNGIAFGHRRLSIVDLSEKGNQPMVSSNGKLVIIYNGEIYNHKEIRTLLENKGIVFKGYSDTEVLLEACSLWGIERTLNYLNGMFAFAIWNREEKKISLVRDRLGIKPLYYGYINKTFFFGSQPKSFFHHPAWKAEIDRESIDWALRHSYIPAPKSVYKGLSQLMPGTIINFDNLGNITKKNYWKAADFKKNYNKNSNSLNFYKEKLDLLLNESVKKRMISEVPLGAFLSGGIDSSTIASIMQANSTKPIQTFCIGFEEKNYDESLFANKVANFLGTEHTELIISPKTAMDLIPEIPSYFDEPFADSSQIPTYLVSKLTQTKVKVSLSGDGGDELFAGYNRYKLANTIRKIYFFLPNKLRIKFAYLLNTIPSSLVDYFFSIMPNRFSIPQASDKLYKLSKVLSLNSIDDLYPYLISFWQNEKNLVLGLADKIDYKDYEINFKTNHFTEDMQFTDIITYLPNDILTKLDRSSMAVSLEARVPFLDHNLVEYSMQIPQKFKLHNGKTKWILREVLNKYVPKKMFERPKMGFGIPIGLSMRGPLRDWVESYINQKKLNEMGLFNSEKIIEKWNLHLNKRNNFQYELWNLLMICAWHEKWMK